MLRYRDVFTLPAMLAARASPPPVSEAPPSTQRGGRTERHGLSSPNAPLDAASDRRAKSDGVPDGGDQPRMLQTPPPRRAERVSALPASRGFAWSKKAALTRGASSSPLEGEGNVLCVLVIFALIVGLGATMAVAQQPHAVKATALEVLVRWAPLLLWGFGFNILISIMAMAIGTVAGLPVGIAQLSRFKAVRIAAGVVTQLFRNSPWLVLLFLCVFLIPFEIRVFGLRIPFPDWAKATMGFSLPVMANTSEIARGAIQSVATGQWDSARALGLTRRQIALPRHPAAVREAHAAAVDEPLFADRHVDGERLHRRRERDDHAHRAGARRRGLAPGPAGAALRLRAGVLLHLLLPDRQVDPGARAPVPARIVATIETGSLVRSRLVAVCGHEELEEARQ